MVVARSEMISAEARDCREWRRGAPRTLELSGHAGVRKQIVPPNPSISIDR